MRRITIALVAGLLLASLAGSASAAAPAARGFLPADAQPHGASLADLLTAWDAWAFSTPEATNPVVAGRCEASPDDPGIWFLPAAMGGESALTCDVPQGVFVVTIVAGSIFSEVTGDGTGAAELRSLAEADFELLTAAEASLDGRAAAGLDRYAVTADPVMLPADNLLGPDPGLTVARGIALVIAPLSPGTHTLRVYDAFASYEFEAGIDFTIRVH
jgi:hypothetical protein